MKFSRILETANQVLKLDESASNREWSNGVKTWKQRKTPFEEHNLSGHDRKFWVATTRSEMDRDFIVHTRDSAPALAKACIEMTETLRWIYDNCNCTHHTCVNCVHILSDRS